MSPNPQLRTLRRAAGLSQERLAERANHEIDRATRRPGALDGNTVSRLERGKIGRPSQHTVDALSKVLGATETELGFARPARTLTVPTGFAVPTYLDDAPADADFVGGMRGMIGHLAALDGVHGGAEVAPLALRSFRRAQRILSEGHYRPAVERDLEAVTAELGELSGWLLFDAERQDEARVVNAEALTLARIAGDTSMEWFVLSNQALASVHTGRNREALRIAQGMTSGDELPGRARALFDVRAARALAALGDAPAALRTFDRARSAFADGTTSRDPGWSWWFDQRELAGHEGMIHAALGNHTQALPLLATAVERSRGREQFRWALYIHRANLLRALLRAGSLADAEQVAADVAAMVGEIASARTEGMLRRTVANPDARPPLPSTLGDTLDHLRRKLGAA